MFGMQMRQDVANNFVFAFIFGQDITAATTSTLFAHPGSSGSSILFRDA